MKKQHLSYGEVGEHALEAAWESVEREFIKPTFANPAPGFALRWRVRQAQSAEQAKRTRAAWTWAGVAVVFALLASLVWLTGNYASVVSTLLSFGVAVSALVVAASQVTLVIMDAMPLSLWLLFTASCVLLMYAWTAVLRWAQMEKE